MIPDELGDYGPMVVRALGGDKAAFDTIADRSRAPLLRHCYRMLGSSQEAEDAVQDTLLRAWQRLATFDGRGSFPGWMYRIATNVCIDHLRGRRRRVDPTNLGPPAAHGSMPESPLNEAEWVEPMADVDIGMGDGPEGRLLGRERISLAFVVALQRLSARQRAALLLHDVLEFTHGEVAEVLDASPSAVNSLLYRARNAIGESPTLVSADPKDPAVKALVARYVRAWELADISEFVATVADDVRLSMPPLPSWYQGSEAVATFVESAIFGPSRPDGVTMHVGSVNGQPALATYAPSPDDSLRVDGLQVLHVRQDGAAIEAITSFRDPALALRCGFPRTIEDPARA